MNPARSAKTLLYMVGYVLYASTINMPIVLCVRVSLCVGKPPPLALDIFMKRRGCRHCLWFLVMSCFSVLTCLCSYFHHLKYKLEPCLPSHNIYPFANRLCTWKNVHFILTVFLSGQKGLFWGRPAQIKFLFSLRVNTTWRHMDDLLTLQGLWDVSTQGRCSCRTTRERVM